MDDYGMMSLMEDPEGYYPPSPPPTKQVYTMRGGKAVTLHLVGHSPTEAHHLWNGAQFVADYLDEEPGRVRGKAVLELGAAAGLPSLVAGILGARRVVMTDFPDPELVANMHKNIDECDGTVEPRGSIARTVQAAGFVWGAEPGPLLARLRDGEQGGEQGQDEDEDEDSGEQNDDDGGGEQHKDDDDDDARVDRGRPRTGGASKFDVLVLADLLFRHSEHGALVKTIKETMRPCRASAAYVFFTSYRPWKQDLDMGFFDVARAAGLEVEQVAERKLERPLFAGDPGDVEVQKTVRGFVVRWPEGGDVILHGNGTLSLTEEKGAIEHIQS
ncbi:hypothetical protein G6O67_008128 [Ophiocordyceps sinensis]|uniref:Elongation factor methyltransferase 7 n=1 Tax=Ophiocordyceps sinensis TaxID=72228 RepID=A0A8H4PKE2_9HYPO|nr:hypothetical protein G6O67_008128 [Ophiocordyceps sinensis]